MKSTMLVRRTPFVIIATDSVRCDWVRARYDAAAYEALSFWSIWCNIFGTLTVRSGKSTLSLSTRSIWRWDSDDDCATYWDFVRFIYILLQFSDSCVHFYWINVRPPPQLTQFAGSADDFLSQRESNLIFKFLIISYFRRAKEKMISLPCG